MYMHNIDLHYHAGQERDAGATIGDYLKHAMLSGRRVLGGTDHYGLLQEARRPDKQYLYEASQAGLRAYHDEVMTCAAERSRLSAPIACWAPRGPHSFRAVTSTVSGVASGGWAVMCLSTSSGPWASGLRIFLSWRASGSNSGTGRRRRKGAEAHRLADAKSVGAPSDSGSLAGSSQCGG